VNNSVDRQTIVIVGAGQAGGEIATALRQQKFEGRIVLIGEEPHLPYKRPPLSKGFLNGSIKLEQLYVVPPATLQKADIELISGTRVTRIDRAAKRVELADGRSIAYDRLALATGGRARPLPLPGANRRNVFPLRTIADVELIRQHAQPGKRAVIVGGGFIGLEVAAVLVKLGLKVTVLEGLPRVLARVTVPEVSAFFERVHREAGVDLRTGVKIEAFVGEPDVTHVQLGDGSRIEADFVVIGIGLIANVELAQEAGLAVDNGIVVDEFARTSDPDIVAAGDCTSHPSNFAGRRLRLESVQNAMEQARHAAGTLVGNLRPYQTVPWFWSDQYDCKLQMVGLSTGFDQMVIRGDPASSRSFAVFYLREGRAIAADAVSRPQDFMFAKKLVATQQLVPAEQLADESVPLQTLIAASA
jgi:3-phenylpropionate/trans-cinnamate dioxygenase ferredoxin reductase subunit